VWLLPLPWLLRLRSTGAVTLRQTHSLRLSTLKELLKTRQRQQTYLRKYVSKNVKDDMIDSKSEFSECYLIDVAKEFLVT
jgi:hypothetical protein